MSPGKTDIEGREIVTGWSSVSYSSFKYQGPWLPFGYIGIYSSLSNDITDHIAQRKERHFAEGSGLFTDVDNLNNIQTVHRIRQCSGWWKQMRTVYVTWFVPSRDLHISIVLKRTTMRTNFKPVIPVFSKGLEKFMLLIYFFSTLFVMASAPYLWTDHLYRVTYKYDVFAHIYITVLLFLYVSPCIVICQSASSIHLYRTWMLTYNWSFIRGYLRIWKIICITVLLFLCVSPCIVICCCAGSIHPSRTWMFNL